ncbi:MAG: hypothetical protein CBC25_05275 [Pelagibacteraceae bacterium TMED65]|nr:hypothetical protein [Rickettsiales bacterium]OUU51473.1 MAG: hypothetical protein CBC25_05275 [Pelagibacteraceae bacterium TMED65]|tara:strand:+ start:764 stop:1129 length:366 start_codon:yes stop_codon:yes gene_type:complete
MSENKISWSEGTTIYKCNDESDFAYFLLEGEILIKSSGGKSVGFVNENEIFGEQSIILGIRRTVTTIASKNSKAIKIPKKQLIKEYQNSSLLIKAILRSTYLRLTNLDSTIKVDLTSLDSF